MEFIDLFLAINAFILIYIGVEKISKAKALETSLVFTIEANKNIFKFYGKNATSPRVEKMVSLILESRKNILLSKEKEILEKNFLVIKRSLMFLSDISHLDKSYVLEFLTELSKEVEIVLMSNDVERFSYLLEQ